jgi:hypothetical protein
MVSTKLVGTDYRILGRLTRNRPFCYNMGIVNDKEIRMSKFQKLAVQISKARARLEDLESQASSLRLETLKQVKMVRNDQSITLLFKDRSINARKNRWGRFTVKEGRKILDSEYFGNIHDLRFDLAVGNV